MFQKYEITNRHNTVIWTGKARSFYDAWQCMFEACKYPTTERFISEQINQGMWIQKVPPYRL